MLPTKPIFPHPPIVNDPLDPKERCQVCGFQRDRAIHYGSHQYPKLWTLAHYWWPAQFDGDVTP